MTQTNAAAASTSASGAARPRLPMIIPSRGLDGAQRAFYDHGVALRDYHDVTEIIFKEDEPDLYLGGNLVRSLGVPGGGALWPPRCHCGGRRCRDSDVQCSR